MWHDWLRKYYTLEQNWDNISFIQLDDLHWLHQSTITGALVHYDIEEHRKVEEASKNNDVYFNVMKAIKSYDIVIRLSIFIYKQ